MGRTHATRIDDVLNVGVHRRRDKRAVLLRAYDGIEDGARDEDCPIDTPQRRVKRWSIRIVSDPHRQPARFELRCLGGGAHKNTHIARRHSIKQAAEGCAPEIAGYSGHKKYSHGLLQVG